MPDRSVVYSFIGRFDSLNAGLTAAGRNVTEFGTKLTALDKNGAKMRAGLSTLGDTAGKVGLVAAGGLALAIGAAANFDKAMSAVQAATHETASNMDDLRQAAIKAGADTQYSATEAAGAIEELAKAGISTSDILGGGLSGSLNLAAAGAIDVADAAELAATAMTQFKLGGDQVNHVADLLAAGAGKAQGSVDDLGMALKQSGLVASQTGLSIEETVGTLSAFASAGLTGSDAGTSFKTMLQALTPTSAKAANLMDELGISAYDAQGNFVGMTEFAGVLRDALSGLSVEQQNAALKTIFGSDAVRAASVIYQQGADGIQGWIDKTNDAGYAAETASTRMDNLAGDLEQLKGSLETALIGAGEGSQGPLRSLVQTLTDLVNGFNDLPSPAKNAVMALGGITAVLGGGLWFTAKTVQGIANTRQALADLGWTADRAGGSLGRMAGTAGKIAGLAGAVAILGNALADATGAKVNVSDLQRDLEALANGTSSDIAKRLAADFDSLGFASNKATEPLYEVTTLFGVLGNTPMDNASDNIAAVDEALASMVESGNADVAAAAFAKIAAAITGLPEGASFDPALIKGFDSYATALDNAAVEAEKTADANEDVGRSGKAAAGGLDQGGKAAERAAERLKKARSAARDTARGFITLGDSLNDGKKSLGEWLHELEKQADALRNFTRNAQTAAKRGLDQGLIKSLNEAGPAGALRMKQLANATDAEIKRANRVWREGQDAIRDYVNMQVPPKKVKVDGSQARRELASIQMSLSQLHDKTILVTTKYHNMRVSSEGSTVPKDGGPYRDRIPYMLAPGEEVISNRRGQADRFRPLLKAINAAADGATVGGYARTGAGGTPAFDFVGPVNAAASALGDLADSSLKELKVRQKLLQNEVDRDKEQLSNLRQMRASLAQSVRDLITGGDLFSVTQAPSGAPSWLNNSDLSREDKQFLIDQYNAQVAAAGSVTSNVGGMLAEGRERLNLIRKLRGMGVDGPALAKLATEPIEVLRELASNRREARQFDRQYEALLSLGAQAGSYVGSAVYGKDIKAQLDELKGLRQDVRRVEAAIKHQTHEDKRNSEDNAKKVASGVNRQVVNAVQRTL